MRNSTYESDVNTLVRTGQLKVTSKSINHCIWTIDGTLLLMVIGLLLYL